MIARVARLWFFRITTTGLALFAGGLVLVGDRPRIGVGVEEPVIPWVSQVFTWVSQAEFLLAAILALFLVWAGSHRAETRSLALFLVFLSLTNFDLPLAQRGLVSESGAVAQWLGVLQAAIPWLALAAFLRFTALFPRSLRREDLQAAGLPGWRSWIIDPTVVWTAALLLSLVSGLLVHLKGRWVHVSSGAFAAALLLWMLMLVGIVWGVHHLRVSYRSSGPVERRRILWVLQGFLFAIWAIIIGVVAFVPGLVLAAVLVWWFSLVPLFLIAVAPLIMLVCLAVAIFYRGAIDPALVIRKTAVYGTFGVVLTFLFAALEQALSSSLAQNLGLPRSSGTWIAAGLTALVLGSPEIVYTVGSRTVFCRGCRSPIRFCRRKRSNARM